MISEKADECIISDCIIMVMNGDEKVSRVPAGTPFPVGCVVNWEDLGDNRERFTMRDENDVERTIEVMCEGFIDVVFA